MLVFVLVLVLVLVFVLVFVSISVISISNSSVFSQVSHFLVFIPFVVMIFFEVIDIIHDKEQ